MSRDPFPTEPRPGADIGDRDSLTQTSGLRNDLGEDGDRCEQGLPLTPISTARRPESEDSPRAYDLRHRTYFLRDSELTTLAEIGTFRVVDASDLTEFSFAGDSPRMHREIRRLQQHGLVEQKWFTGDRGERKRLLVLTKRGKNLARKSGRVPEGQAIYHGLVKVREAKHDAALYRLYQKEAARICGAGGKPLRVSLDYELKRILHRDLAAYGEAGRKREVRERVAAKHGLPLVGDRVQIPDLRLEYENSDSERKRVDLELTTRNYHPGALAYKAKAGFSLYATREDVSRLRRILDEAELTARIFSL